MDSTRVNLLVLQVVDPGLLPNPNWIPSTPYGPSEHPEQSHFFLETSILIFKKQCHLYYHKGDSSCPR